MSRQDVKKIGMSPKQIRELMKLRNWTQANLARQLDMSEATVSRWLDGTRKPTGGTRKLLLHWLSESKDELRELQPA